MARELRDRVGDQRAGQSALRHVRSVADMHRGAQRALPRSVLDFIEGGAEDEVTIARNRSDFEQLTLLPRVLRDVSVVNLATTVLGQPVSLPVLAAPTGLTTMVHPLGEVGVAEAVSRAGTVYLASGAGGQSPEAVAAATTGPAPWFQLYLWRDRGLVRELLARTRESGFAALAFTVDVPRGGRRERDLRNGFTIPPRITAGTIAQGLARPRWSARFLRSGGLGLGDIDRQGTPQSWSERVNTQTDPSLTWAELEWLRGEWSRPLLVKGVLHPDDAARAVDCGVNAVIVSNHGGRQSTAPARRSRPCRGSSRQSVTGPRSCSTGACAEGPTSSRRSPSVPGPASWAGRCSTGWPRLVSTAPSASSSCCARSS
jgi:L-lactate dehydrogenase (cytochrome)